jgi:perosamine synthetase
MKIVKSLENRPNEVLAALYEVLHSGAYSEGKYLTRIRSQLYGLMGVTTTPMNSCGSALFTAFSWLKSEGHTTALIQNNTFYATGAMAKEAGLNVALVDSRSDCPSMSVDSLKEAYKKQPLATVVVLTHVGGWLAKDYLAIAAFCAEANLFLLEDCAHAVGLSGAGKLGDASCWSFYPTKAVPSGEGGALSTNHAPLHQFAELFCSYGKYHERGAIRYNRGFNLRMSEWDAAVLSVQLDSLPDILAARRRDAAVLQSIAPCLLEGESNFYKYPVSSEYRVLRTVGAVYAVSDQLLTALSQSYEVEVPVPLLNSIQWAKSHVCLPVGEGLYDNLSKNEVFNLLKA